MISVGEVRHALVMFSLQIDRLIFNCKTITRKEKHFVCNQELIALEDL
jgi:hypothetical protein